MTFMMAVPENKNDKNGKKKLLKIMTKININFHNPKNGIDGFWIVLVSNEIKIKVI